MFADEGYRIASGLLVRSVANGAETHTKKNKRRSSISMMSRRHSIVDCFVVRGDM